MDLADGVPDGDADGGGILEEPPPDNGIEPPVVVSSEPPPFSLSSPEEFPGSPPDWYELSSAERFEEPGAGVPVAWDEVEEGGTVPCVPEVLPVGELELDL